MSSGGITMDIDFKPLIEKFKQLEGKDKVNAIKRSVGKALRVIKNATISSMQQSGVPINKSNARYGFTPADGVTINVYKDGTGGNVSILKNYLLRFIEKGTVERFQTTKKGNKKNVGAVQPRWFFRRARQTSESQAVSVLNQSLEEEIQKLFDKI